MPSLRECIDRYEAGLATRPADRRVNLIRVAMLPTTSWRQDIGFLVDQRLASEKNPDVICCRALAALGEHLALDRVGRVVS